MEERERQRCRYCNHLDLIEGRCWCSRHHHEIEPEYVRHGKVICDHFDFTPLDAFGEEIADE